MRDMTKLHPRLQEKAVQLKKKCKKQGISILFSECLRTREEQDALYAQGRTVPGNIVTNAKGSNYSSQHQWGIAIDFYLNMDVNGDGNKKDDAFNNSTQLLGRRLDEHQRPTAFVSARLGQHYHKIKTALWYSGKIYGYLGFFQYHI